jgi:hypothetical protein
MAVYVDNARIPWRRMIMSHLTADDIDELHEFAERLGMRRRWFQDGSIPHYDLSEGKRQLALKLGAVHEDIWDHDDREWIERHREFHRRADIRRRALQKLREKQEKS